MPIAKTSVGDRRSNSRLGDWLIVLNIILRIYSAFYMIISDCDETFNYWESLNLLVRGFGKETWEYSPEYAIRSYFYLIPYYVISYPLSYLSKIYNLPPYYQFYWIRLIALCGFTSFTEYKLYESINKNINNRVGNWFLFLSSIAPGMSHAGVALLPSSFAMNCITMATANLLSAISNDNDIAQSVQSLAWFMIGGLVGWPFALALALPFGLYLIITEITKSDKLFSIIKGSVTVLVIILSFLISIDSYFYQKYVLVPLNIVLYNVFGGEGVGPEIFGVEPFHYYIFNLLVNFNIVAVLGYFGLFFNTLVFYSTNRFKSMLAVSLPLLVWSSIFGAQPHKEERFLYPIYPILILSASLSLSKLLPICSAIINKVFRDKINSKHMNKLVHILFGALVGAVSILRILNLVANYSAPISTYIAVSSLPESDIIINVCTGREWYHYPNSFFLPNNYRLKFVKSGFDGLLPGDFQEGKTSLKEATSLIPLGMNNRNKFSDATVINFDECSYYVDNSEPASDSEPSVIETDNAYLTLANGWSILRCNKLINPSGKSSGIGKIIWIPEFLRIFIPYNVDYMEFCVLKRV